MSGERLLESAEQVGGVTVVVAEVPGVEGNLMRQLIDQVRGKSPSSAVLLASRQGDDKVTLVAGISKDLQAREAERRRVDSARGGGGWRRRRRPARYGPGGRQGAGQVARSSPDCQGHDSQDACRVKAVWYTAQFRFAGQVVTATRCGEMAGLVCAVLALQEFIKRALRRAIETS